MSCGKDDNIFGDSTYFTLDIANKNMIPPASREWSDWSTIANNIDPVDVVPPEEFEDLKSEFKEYKRLTNERMVALQEHVVMIDRDLIMEDQYEELKAAWKAYDELLDKLKTFKALKDSA